MSAHATSRRCVRRQFQPRRHSGNHICFKVAAHGIQLDPRTRTGATYRPFGAKKRSSPNAELGKASLEWDVPRVAAWANVGNHSRLLGLLDTRMPLLRVVRRAYLAHQPIHQAGSLAQQRRPVCCRAELGIERVAVSS